MKKFIPLLVAATFMLVVLPSAADAVIFYADNSNIDVGTVTYTDGGTTLTVVFTMTSPWKMFETHVDVVADPDDFPMTGSGNPKVGHFEYKTEHTGGTVTYTYNIDLEALDLEAAVELYVAAQAEVHSPGIDGTWWNEDDLDESAWGNGTGFPGSNWAMYFQVRL